MNVIDIADTHKRTLCPKQGTWYIRVHVIEQDLDILAITKTWQKKAGDETMIAELTASL